MTSAGTTRSRAEPTTSPSRPASTRPASCRPAARQFAPVANVIAPFAPARASALIFDVLFLEPVVGLSRGDFTRTGTATGCTINTPTTIGPTTYQVAVTGCSTGTLRLTLKASSVGAGGDPTVLGPASAVSSPATVRIDRSPPTVGTLSATLRQGAQLSGTALPVRLSWSGSDIGTAGIDYYRVWKTTKAAHRGPSSARRAGQP